MLRGGWINPQIIDSESEFSLIKYLETHEVENYSDFEAVISAVSPESIDSIDSESVADFCINIDYENQIVSVLTDEEPIITSSGVSDTVSCSYYNDLGFKIFTISITGYFTYSSGWCYTSSASGSYTRASLSTWTSTPTISSGNFTSTVAYARISGTATSGSNNLNYSLTLTCDDDGDLNSY